MSGLVSLGEAMAAVLVPWEARAAAARRPGRPKPVASARSRWRAAVWALELRHGQRASRLEAGRKAKRA